MSILHEIANFKKEFVDKQKQIKSIDQLEKAISFKRVSLSMETSILNSSLWGIIAEFKRKSPSKPIINDFSSPSEMAQIYSNYGASGMSVLTDEKYFGGKNADLIEAKKISSIPVLRKDFIVDEYQIIEAKSIGADAILLIADILTKQEIKQFTATAQNIGLEVLFEIHTIAEFDKFHPNINLLGVNNRNLKTFEVNLQTSMDISKIINGEYTIISESGLKTTKDIILLKEAGFNGFLIGETFMKSDNPKANFKQFMQELKRMS